MMENDTIEVRRIHEHTISVLVVEDDELLRERLSTVLESAGYGVLGVATCAEARAVIGGLVVPMLIVDRMLPDGDGLDLIQEFRIACAPNKIYILLLTSLDGNQDRSDGLAAGADDYLSKRCTEIDILNCLHRALRSVKLRSK